MADGSAIEWTDATWQPITGCGVVSPGCTNCYAMKLAGTRLRQHPSRAGLTFDTRAGPVWSGEVRFNEQWLLQPLAWRKPRRIFVCAHGDLFHENIPVRDQCRAVGVPFFFKQWGAYQPKFPQYADEFGVEEGDMLCDGYEFPAEGVLYRNGHFYDGVEYQPHTGAGAYWMSRVGKKAAGRHLDGKLHDEFPTRENCNGV